MLAHQRARYFYHLSNVCSHAHYALTLYALYDYHSARYVFQGVHMLMGLSSSADGVGRSWKDGEPRVNRIIFIGRKLNRDELLRSFMECTVVKERASAVAAAAKAAAQS